MSLAYHLKRGIITERPNTYDFKYNIPNAKPYWMHRIRFWLQDKKYAKKINTVFAMGREAVDYFQSLGMKWQVFPFCYCTQPSSSFVVERPLSSDALPQYLFCGNLSTWKAPLTIIQAISHIDATSWGGINLIGEGALRLSLEKEIMKLNLEDKIHLLGTKPQTEIPLFMWQSDIFILPSIYDGWGAVVNEALQAGCYVICSDAAGASDLILQDERLGKVFHHGNSSQLADCMIWCNKHIAEIRKNRKYRIMWTEEHISGKAVARYMIDCLQRTSELKQ